MLISLTSPHALSKSAYTYDLDFQGITITGCVYICSNNLILPERINGCPVTGTGE
jgi:hypothetical protein